MLSPGAADNDDGLGHQLVDLRLCPMMQVKTLHHALLVEPVELQDDEAHALITKQIIVA